MSIKQKIFDYLRKKQPVREPRFPHMDQSLKVMLIYESDVLERNDAIKKVRQELLRKQMDVTTWGYVEKKVISTLILPQSRILGTADYNWLGKPRDYVLNDLQAEHYDLLIDLTIHPSLPLQYLAMYTNADFKVGLKVSEGLHDMLIAADEIDESGLFEQIIRYLTSIRSMD